ncbi:winged helix-turn-helix transcriptional regulator [Aestuariispira ectoiniformans]|uniref:winged helix-turn-helix transcriptional regulator n=1 Tax=Aestuariispira ectoiniformans TaxID=2775080 RepID=UPI00223B124C|nr:helix-turn-helix domain-containing protein [Aestuariispira ectoiniformans]
MALKIRKNQSPKVPYNCPLSECMSVLGGAWTPNIVWSLCAGPRRFSELRTDIPGVSAKVLTARLRDLEIKGVISREIKPTSPPSVEYALTELGQELMPVIKSIVEVGHKLKKAKLAEAEECSAAVGCQVG